MPIEDFTQYHREYWYRRRQRVLDHLGGVCVQCGSTEKLHIDHVDPALKEFNINYRCSLTPDTLAELEKCQVLCESCHTKKTAAENSGFTHGSIYGWQKAKCECEECMAAKRLWHNERNAKRRQPNGRGPYRPRF